MYPDAALVTGASTRTTIGWAGGALLLTTAVAIAAKVLGVVIAPGARGLASERTMNLLETTSGTLAYALTTLLVVLVCGGSFELARSRTVHVIARGAVVASSGLVIALASPAVVGRLPTEPTVALGAVSSLVALVAGAAVVRAAHTRAVGGVLLLFALTGLLRLVAWGSVRTAFERGSTSLLVVAQGLSTVAVSLQALAALLAAAWIGTRSRWRGRILANLAILVAFGITWLAARGGDAPSAIEQILHVTLPGTGGIPAPYLLGSIAAFLLPATLLLAAVALLQRDESPELVAALGLALVANGAFDVPIHALLVTAAGQWALLAASRDQRLGVKHPTSPPPSLPSR